ncbi:MAG: OmpH family outer membrane protein [Planctomycetota bacterium]
MTAQFKIGRLLVGACAITLLGMVLGPAEAESGSESDPDTFRITHLAVVNVDRVLEESRQWQDRREELDQMRERMQNTIDRKERGIRVLEGEYENLPQGTERAQKKRNEIQEAMEDYQETRRDFERELAEKRDRFLTDVMTKINEAVEALAEERDLDLVLKAADPEMSEDGTEESAMDRGALLQRASVADVLFARDRLDISDRVIERLDARYTGEIVDPPPEPSDSE